LKPVLGAESVDHNKTDLYREYLGRINRVIDYIEENLAEKMTLEELAGVANFSKYHFHRIFYAFLGETLFQFIQRLRLQKSKELIAIRENASLTEIAYDCGFSSSAAFSRSFKKRYDMTPSQWKKEVQSLNNQDQADSNLNQAECKEWKEKIPRTLYNHDILRNRRRIFMNKSNVEVKALEEMTVAYVRYMGPYAGNEKLFETLFGKLYSWAAPRGLDKRPEAKNLIIYHDNPEITEEEKLRVSVCLTVPEDTEVNGEIGKMEIPGGLYAMASFNLSADEYGEAWNWTFGQWLPSSGYLPDERPCFELYPENEAQEEGKQLVNICIPVKSM